MTRPPSRRAFLSLGAAGALAGCGFRPVYMADDKGPEPAAALAAIDVKPMYERPGQMLREHLKARLATDTGVPKKYDLQVNFWVYGEGIGILSFTQFTRVRLTGAANWTLTARGPNPVKLTEGSDKVIDGFDMYDAQYFAMDLSNEQVQRRLAEHIADDIALRLAMYFHQHPATAG